MKCSLSFLIFNILFLWNLRCPFLPYNWSLFSSFCLVIFDRFVWAAMTTQRPRVTAWCVWSSCVWRVSRPTKGSSSLEITLYARRKICHQVLCCTWQESSDYTAIPMTVLVISQLTWFPKLSSCLYCRSNRYNHTEACVLWHPQAGATEVVLWDMRPTHLSRLSAA